MGFRLVSGGGNVIDPAMVNLRASGVIWPGSVVEFSRTGGAGVNIASAASTGTMIFGVSQTYLQGASDVEAVVIPFVPGQLWEADCTDAILTAQIGLRHQLNAGAKEIRNTSTDMGAGNAHSAVFRAVAMVGSTTGSGKLIGYFRNFDIGAGQNQSTYI